MRKLLSFINNLTLRTKLVVTYVALIIIPIFYIGFGYFNANTEVITEISQKNTYELVKKNNEIIDVKLLQIMNNIYSFITDKDLVNSFDNIDQNDDYSILLVDNKVTNYLNKYFLYSEDIYSAQLATSYFVFGPRPLAQTVVKSLIPEGSFIGSPIHSIAEEGNGKIKWIPTYDFAEMFNIEYLKNVDVDYKYMFSAVVEVNGSYYENGVFTTLSDDIEKPYLILNFKEDFFQQVYRNSIPAKGSYYFVITKDGQIVSHQNPDMITKNVSYSWLDDLIVNDSGASMVEIDGENMIVCHSKSKITEWVSVVVVPPDRLVDEIIPVIKSYIFYTSIITTIISIFIVYFLSVKITNPISNLTKAIKKTGEGSFDFKMEVEGSRESRELINKFNVMNEKIGRLIQENYEAKINEKEAEITALSLQLDPHFMYNTLNMINLISIENGQDEISDMLICLSKMLKYTVKTKKDLVAFRLDIEYLQSYILIMTKRFEEKFTVDYDIESRLYDYTVPKFFLQPFVENSIIHGFESLDRHGILRISCFIDSDKRVFIIEDNGKGMTPEKLKTITSDEKGSIGINNIIKRIKIMYGNEYGVTIYSALDQGTKVTVTLPLYV